MARRLLVYSHYGAGKPLTEGSAHCSAFFFLFLLSVYRNFCYLKFWYWRIFICAVGMTAPPFWSKVFRNAFRVSTLKILKSFSLHISISLRLCRETFCMLRSISSRLPQYWNIVSARIFALFWLRAYNSSTISVNFILSLIKERRRKSPPPL